MKVVFVDVDGVLLPQRDAAVMRGGRWYSPWVEFDPICMNNLAQLVQATGAKLVISSAWRRVTEEFDLLSWQNLKRNLAQWGLEPYDAIPFLPCESRGAEIAAWLAAQPQPIHRFCILEDREPLSPFEGQCIRCDWRRGFEEKELACALFLLTGERL